MMIRAELISSHDEVWKQLARPGARLSGAERVAIAAESRQARCCAFCKAHLMLLGVGMIRQIRICLGRGLNLFIN